MRRAHQDPIHLKQQLLESVRRLLPDHPDIGRRLIHDRDQLAPGEPGAVQDHLLGIWTKLFTSMELRSAGSLHQPIDVLEVLVLPLLFVAHGLFVAH